MKERPQWLRDRRLVAENVGFCRRLDSEEVDEGAVDEETAAVRTDDLQRDRSVRKHSVEECGQVFDLAPSLSNPRKVIHARASRDSRANRTGPRGKQALS